MSLAEGSCHSLTPRGMRREPLGATHFLPVMRGFNERFGSAGVTSKR